MVWLRTPRWCPRIPSPGQPPWKDMLCSWDVVALSCVTQQFLHCLTPWQWDDGPGFFSISWLSLKAMSADLTDKLRTPKVIHNVTNTRCPLGSLFIRSKHGFWPSEGFFAALPPCQPPILTLHVSNGTPITDQLVFFSARECFPFLKWYKWSQAFT